MASLLDKLLVYDDTGLAFCNLRTADISETPRTVTNENVLVGAVVLDDHDAYILQGPSIDEVRKKESGGGSSRE